MPYTLHRVSALCLLCVATALGSGHCRAAAEADDPLFSDLPVVLTTARLRQAQSDAPAAVTVLDRALIRASGARSLPELLALVPGMQIGMVQGHAATVGYHGMVDELAHRLQVLIDGRSVYEAALARVQWFDIPVLIEDIERIEVTRGPSAALYGANSFTAIINISTVSGDGLSRAATRVYSQVGDDGIYAHGLRHQNLNDGGSQWRVHLAARGDDGFDVDRAGKPRADSHDARTLNAQWQSDPRAPQRWLLQAGDQSTRKQIQYYDDFEPPPRVHDLDNRNQFLLLRWEADLRADHQLSMRAYSNHNRATEAWTTCPPRIYLSDELGALYAADSRYTLQLLDALSRGKPVPTPQGALAPLVQSVLKRVATEQLRTVCGTGNQNLHEQRHDFELQDTRTISDSLRLVSGLSWRREQAESETYFGGSQTSDAWRVFANAEWRLRPDLLLHGGGTFDHEDVGGDSFSPRLAANWQLNGQHTLRAVWSQATRTPDLYEQYGTIRYTVRDLQTPVNGDRNWAHFFQSARSPGDLDPEQIDSRELGWFAHFHDQQLTLDVRLFQDRFTDLLIGNLNVQRFDIGNNGEAEQRGAEVQLQWRPSDTLRMHYGWSHVDTVRANASRFGRSTAPYTRHALLAWTPEKQWEFSLGHYAMSQLWDFPWSQLSARAAHRIDLDAHAQLTVEINLRQRLENGAWFDIDNRFDARQTVWLQAALSF